MLLEFFRHGRDLGGRGGRFGIGEDCERRLESAVAQEVIEDVVLGGDVLGRVRFELRLELVAEDLEAFVELGGVLAEFVRVEDVCLRELVGDRCDDPPRLVRTGEEMPVLAAVMVVVMMAFRLVFVVVFLAFVLLVFVMIVFGVVVMVVVIVVVVAVVLVVVPVVVVVAAASVPFF